MAVSYTHLGSELERPYPSPKGKKKAYKLSLIHIFWLIYLVIGILLGFDFMMGNQAKDTLGVCMQGAAMILAIPYFLSLLYVLSLIHI